MKIYLDTLGCPKNQNDSELAAGLLEKAGHDMIESPEGAEAIIVNTCGFINDAKKESIDRIFEMTDTKDEKCILAVTGCLSKRYKEELFKEMPEVDIFLGVDEYDKLPELLEGFSKGKRHIFPNCDIPSFLDYSNRKLNENPYSCTIKIAEGCDNICAYCIIPKIRGGYRSRTMEDILAEAELLAGKGCKELILIAQDTTAYGQDIYGQFKLPELLKKLCKIEKLKWIRLMYCYEDRITDELIQVMTEEDKICKYLDMPLQHGSGKVLKAMNRRSTPESIRKTVSKLRRAMPDIHIRTTLITGFPGEGSTEFDELYDFVGEMQFERLGVFAYSKEEGTPAAEMNGQVRSDVKERRKDAIMRLQIEISWRSNQEKVGNNFNVMVEDIDEEGAYIGRTSYDAPEIDNSVIFTSEKELKAGEIVKVEIVDAFDYDLVGREVTI